MEKIPRSKLKAIAREVRSILVDRFPECFYPKRTHKKPLKIGIYEDLVARCSDLSGFKIQAALSDYCGGPSYKAALAKRLERVDLDGKSQGPVDDGVATKAQEYLIKNHPAAKRRWLSELDVKSDAA